ncbi:MAG: hypothetical protein IAE91_06765 [Ignavibacteriaceae bacterium]|nr:hypothetical protein [Ignavibacteriaceae bacterium]
MSNIPFCNNCGSELQADQIDIANDTGHCLKCNTTTKLSSNFEILDESIQPLEKLTNPPTKSITLAKTGENSYEIRLSRSRSRASGIALLVFSAIWFSFLFFLGVFTDLELFFSLYMIPFWIVGTGLVMYGINLITEIQKIAINYDSITISKQRLIKPVNLSINFKDIISITIEISRSDSVDSNGGTSTSYHEFPTITYKNGRKTFFETAKLGEKHWVIGFLNSIYSNAKKLNKDIV